MEIKAFIFDLDGVLTDTAEYHYRAWKDLADKLGMTFDRQDNERLKGVSRLDSLEIILKINGQEHAFSQKEKMQLTEEKNKLYTHFIQKITPGDILPGVLPFLADAHQRGIRLAVASASKNAGAVLAGLQIANKFNYIADAAKIAQTKPDPEVFLDCAKNLNLSPNTCIGFEDAQAGIKAIHAAGMYAVGLSVDVVSDPPDLILNSTKELVCEKVLAIASAVKL